MNQPKTCPHVTCSETCPFKDHTNLNICHLEDGHANARIETRVLQ